MLLVRCFKLRLLLKPFWGLSWGPVGGLLGSQEGPGRGSWRLLGPAWGHLGPSWLPLPRFGPFRAPKRAPREANLSPFGTILGPQEASKRPFGVVLGPKEALEGLLWVPVASSRTRGSRWALATIFGLDMSRAYLGYISRCLSNTLVKLWHFGPIHLLHPLHHRAVESRHLFCGVGGMRR